MQPRRNVQIRTYSWAGLSFHGSTSLTPIRVSSSPAASSYKIRIPEHVISDQTSPIPSFLMAFNYKIRPEIDMESNDDDVFYVEIRRQILLLTAEEDEDNGDLPGTKNSSSARSAKLCSGTKNSSSARSAKLCSGSGWSAALLPGSYFTWSETQESATVPAWLVSLWRSGNGGNGTGVFIPHIVKSRRQQRPQERNGRGRMYKPVAYKNE